MDTAKNFLKCSGENTISSSLFSPAMMELDVLCIRLRRRTVLDIVVDMACCGPIYSLGDCEWEEKNQSFIFRTNLWHQQCDDAIHIDVRVSGWCDRLSLRNECASHRETSSFSR